MSIKTNIYNHLSSQFIDLSKFDIPNDQKALKEAVRQLPSIPFTHLNSPSLSIQGAELLQEAKALSSQISNLFNKESKLDHLEKAFKLYKSFIKLNKRQIYQSPVSKAATDAIYVALDICDISKDESKKKSLELAIRKLQVISTYSTALHGNSLHQGIDDALNIPQRHFAITSQPLGTTNVRDCIFFVLRNKKTYSTFAAHIDRNTDTTSIIEAIKKYLPPGEFDNYLIGSHLSLGPDIAEHDLSNLSKVNHLLTELKMTGYHFDSHYWVLQENTPINIVYYPVENQFFEAVPKKELSSYPSCEILIYLDQENKKILPYFIDQQQMEPECSLCLSPLVQKKLNLLLDEEGKFSKEKTLEMIWEHLPPSLRTYTHTKAIVTAYSKTLDEVFLMLKLLSPDSCDTSIKRALKQNRTSSFYILPFSKEKNAGLIQEVLSSIISEK